MKIVFYSIIGVVVVIVGVWAASGKLKVSVETVTRQASTSVSASITPASSPAASVPASPAASLTQAAGTFTMAQVAVHNSRTSCYSVIRGSVYDLTSYIDTHPGGPQKILSICGKDGSALFEDQHGGSAKQENMLATLKIGVLAQ
jgi:cytochrome b involved in lipid metabolism